MAFVLIGCKKNQLDGLFEMESTQSFVLPAGLNSVESHFFRIEKIPSSLPAQLKSRNLKLDDINRIQPKEFTFTSLESNSQYSFIQDVTINIYSRLNNTKKEIAFLDPVPPNTDKVIHLFPTLVDVKDYMSEEFYNVEIRIRVRGFAPRSIQTRVDLIFEVN